MKRLRKLRDLSQRLGLRGTLRLLLSFAASAVYSTQTELVLLKTLDSEGRCQGDGWRIRPITRDTYGAVRAFNERYRGGTEERVTSRYLENGYRGFVVDLQGDVAGYWWWVDRENMPVHPCITRFQLTLTEGDVYGFDYFIAPEFRSHGAGVKILSRMYCELRRLGYENVWAFVDARNLPARMVYTIKKNKVVRSVVSRSLFSTVLLQDRRVFVKRRRSNDYEVLFSLPW